MTDSQPGTELDRTINGAAEHVTHIREQIDPITRWIRVIAVIGSLATSGIISTGAGLVWFGGRYVERFEQQFVHLSNSISELADAQEESTKEQVQMREYVIGEIAARLSVVEREISLRHEHE